MSTTYTTTTTLQSHLVSQVHLVGHGWPEWLVFVVVAAALVAVGSVASILRHRTRRA